MYIHNIPGGLDMSTNTWLYVACSNTVVHTWI